MAKAPSLAIAALAALALSAAAHAADPIKIGFSMALTGPYSANGKAALLAEQMWAEDQNAKGGLLGRPIQLVYYDDQSTTAQVPGIYTKLIDVDKVDLVVSGYGTATVAAAMPTVMQRGFAFVSLFGLSVNEQFKYDRYFQIAPFGSGGGLAFSQGFFDVAMTMNPKPKSLAIVIADSEFPQTAAAGAREWAKKYGLSVVYDRSFPPTTVDFSPVVRAVQAAKPDIVYIACFPQDTVGLVRAMHETGFAPKLAGGGMVGPQYAALKQQLGPGLNGIMTFETYVPAKTTDFPGIKAFLDRYQPKATGAGVDALGYYLPPFAYAGLQVLGDAVAATGSLDQKKIAEHMHKTTFHTVVGDVKFNGEGEWDAQRMFQVQYQNIKDGSLDQFKTPGTQVILFPDAFKSGTLQYPR
jgi:branched-chain amino acid transport system substrate-binding protein